MQLGSQDGRAAVYDLAQSTFTPVDTVDVTGLDSPVHSIAFSPGPGPRWWLAACSGDAVSVYALRKSLLGGRRGMDAAERALDTLLAAAS